MLIRGGLFLLAVATFGTTVFSEEPKPADINAVRMYVPNPQLAERFGEDIESLAKYVKAVEKKANDILAKETKPKAKGLLIAVGIKSKKNTRVWCQAVDGEIPEELLKKLETELAKIEAVDLKKSPAGFGLEIKLFGQKPEKFPEFPKLWVDAAKKTDKGILIPPDELFKSIWPD